MKSFGTVFECLLETGGVPFLAVWYGCVRNLAAVWPVSLREGRGYGASWRGAIRS